MLNRKYRTTLALLAACVIPIPQLLRADTTADQLRTHETQQQQILTKTQQIAEQIDAIIGEFDRNGMSGGQDVKTLHAIRANLGQMSGEQMQKVIALLQQARGANDGGLDQEKQAYLTQQGILGEFRNLLREFDKQQSLYTLADRFDRLAKRQAANLRSVVDVAHMTAGRKPEQLDPASLAAVQTQQSEQTGIADEVNDALAAGQALLADASGPEAEQLNKAIAAADASHLSTTVLSAASDLQTGDLFRAAGAEKNARDALRNLADLLAPPKDKLEIKKDQLSQIESAIQKQKEVVDHSKTFDSSPSAQRQEDRAEAANVDDTDEARRKLQNISPTVAAALKDAELKMQQTRDDISKRRRNQAAPDSVAAADQLEQAKDALQKEIAKDQADAAATKTSDAGDKLAQSKQLLDQVKQLRDQQQAIATTQHSDAGAKDQHSLASKANELQQQAAADTPAAAAKLDDAGKAMEQASDSIAKSDTPSTADHQKAADSALAGAQDALQQKVDQLQKTQDELTQLQQSQQEVAQLIQKQAQVAAATALQGTKPAPDHADAPQAATAQQQTQVAQQTEQAQAQIPDQSQPAAAALHDAQQQMKQAAEQIQKADTPSAQTAQGQAMTNLGKAAVALNAKMDDLKNQLGQPTGDPAAQQAAENALNQAQQQLQAAQGDLAKAESGQPDAAKQAQQNLGAAAQAAAAVLSKNDSQAAATELGKAIAQMNQADAQTDQGQTAPAQQSAADAADALAKAQAALAAQDAPSAKALAQKAPESAVPDPAGQGGDQPNPGPRAAQDDGARNGSAGASAFVQLPARDRQALEQSQAEKYPEEYGNMVEQYLKNLSNPDGK